LFSAWDFTPFVETNPQIAWSLMETIAERLASRLASTACWVCAAAYGQRFPWRVAKCQYAYELRLPPE
jgi:hypothetical protein